MLRVIQVVKKRISISTPFFCRNQKNAWENIQRLLAFRFSCGRMKEKSIRDFQDILYWSFHSRLVKESHWPGEGLLHPQSRFVFLFLFILILFFLWRVMFIPRAFPLKFLQSKRSEELKFDSLWRFQELKADYEDCVAASLTADRQIIFDTEEILSCTFWMQSAELVALKGLSHTGSLWPWYRSELCAVHVLYIL